MKKRSVPAGPASPPPSLFLLTSSSQPWLQGFSSTARRVAAKSGLQTELLFKGGAKTLFLCLFSKIFYSGKILIFLCLFVCVCLCIFDLFFRIF